MNQLFFAIEMDVGYDGMTCSVEQTVVALLAVDCGADFSLPSTYILPFRRFMNRLNIQTKKLCGK